MKPLTIRLGALAGALALLTGCSGGNSLTGQAERELGLDLSAGTVAEEQDGRGGFHGDGVSLLTVTFTGDELLTQLQDSADWPALPMDDTAAALAYGLTETTETTETTTGPMLTDGEGRPLLPEVEKGWYRLIDRQTEGEGDILARPSYNLTLAVYDETAATLYVGRLDT